VCYSPGLQILVAELLEDFCSHPSADQVLELGTEEHTAAKIPDIRSGVFQTQWRA
jgi:hypothetical protein